MLIFATTNSRKIKEATDALSPLQIEFQAQAVAIDEIQHSDPLKIIKAKAKSAYQAVGGPVLVSDTNWSIPALGGFPGGYMKDVANWWAADDWLAIMSRHRDRSITCQEYLAFYDGQTLECFWHDYQGRFVDGQPQVTDHLDSFEDLVILYGDKTISQQLAEGLVASAGEQLFHFQKFADWYGSRSG